jgi:hypothetical protein
VTLIYLLRDKAQSAQIQEMLQEYSSMIKIAVDIRQNILLDTQTRLAKELSLVGIYI